MQKKHFCQIISSCKIILSHFQLLFNSFSKNPPKKLYFDATETNWCIFISGVNFKAQTSILVWSEVRTHAGQARPFGKELKTIVCSTTKQLNVDLAGANYDTAASVRNCVMGEDFVVLHGSQIFGRCKLSDDVTNTKNELRIFLFSCLSCFAASETIFLLR